MSQPQSHAPPVRCRCLLRRCHDPRRINSAARQYGWPFSPFAPLGLIAALVFILLVGILVTAVFLFLKFVGVGRLITEILFIFCCCVVVLFFIVFLAETCCPSIHRHHEQCRRRLRRCRWNFSLQDTLQWLWREIHLRLPRANFVAISDAALYSRCWNHRLFQCPRFSRNGHGGGGGGGDGCDCVVEWVSAEAYTMLGSRVAAYLNSYAATRESLCERAVRRPPVLQGARTCAWRDMIDVRTLNAELPGLSELHARAVIDARGYRRANLRIAARWDANPFHFSAVFPPSMAPPLRFALDFFSILEVDKDIRVDVPSYIYRVCATCCQLTPSLGHDSPTAPWAEVDWSPRIHPQMPRTFRAQVRALAWLSLQAGSSRRHAKRARDGDEPRMWGSLPVELFELVIGAAWVNMRDAAVEWCLHERVVKGGRT